MSRLRNELAETKEALRVRLKQVDDCRLAMGSQRKLTTVDNSKEWLDRMKSGAGLYWRGDGGYVSWDGEQEEICLDGDFSVEQLKLIIEYMQSVKHKVHKGS